MADGFWSAGYAVIDDFVDLPACADLLDRVNEYRAHHELPKVERHARNRDLRYQVIDGARIADALPSIGDLLTATDRTVAELSCRRLLRLEGQAGVNVNVTPSGGSYRWHYDRCPVTVMLYLNAVSGGEMELYPNHRLRCGPFVGTTVQRYSDAVAASRSVRRLARVRHVAVRPAPGRLLVIRGDRCLHAVSEVGDGPDRINLVVSYITPGAEPSLPDLDSYLYSDATFERQDPNYRHLRR
jgi:hypothetical protein